MMNNLLTTGMGSKLEVKKKKKNTGWVYATYCL